MNGAYEFKAEHRTVRVSTDAALLKGTLAVPNNALGVVLFAHGSGSSPHSPRNRYVAQALHEARLATLLISVVDMNREALEQIRGEKRLEIVPGATHLFEEPGALERVAWLAASWFVHYLGPVVEAR
jgi:putative phosphoribosyl transferase